MPADLPPLDVPAWTPPRLDPAEADFAARLTRRRQPALAAGWALQAGLPEPVEDPERHPIAIAGHPAALDLPRDLADALLLTLDPAAAAAGGAARRLLLELAAEDVLDALDAVLPITEVGGGADLPIAIGLTLQFGDAAWPALLHASPAAAGAVMAALATLEPAPVLPDISVALSMRAGACDLSWPELRALQPGDVLLPAAGLDGTMLLVAQERMVWQGRADPAGGALAVLSPRHRPSALGVEDWMMDSAAPQPGGGHAAHLLQDAELDELPVRLVFEAGRIEVPVGELSVIGPGHVFEIPGRAGLVDIVSGGRRIGQGELVQVGDAAGVRVLRLGPAKP